MQKKNYLQSIDDDIKEEHLQRFNKKYTPQIQ